MRQKPGRNKLHRASPFIQDGTLNADKASSCQRVRQGALSVDPPLPPHLPAACNACACQIPGSGTDGTSKSSPACCKLEDRRAT